MLTASAAHAAYRAGNADQALDITGRVLAANPSDPTAHLVRGLIAFRRGDGPQAVAALKGCLAARSGEWLFERVQQDSGRLGRPDASLETALKVGGLLRAALPQFGPVAPPPLRRADHEYVNVVGSSYVRSFGGSPALFPLYIGQGPFTLLLDDVSAATTRRMVAANLKRLDPRRNTLFALGSDPSYYLQLLGKRGETRPSGVIDADFAAMDAVARRHRLMLSEAQALISGKVILLGITPHFDDQTNVLGIYLNRRLRMECEAAGVGFIDAWDALVDPATGRLREDLAAKAYPGDAHFAVEATEIFIELLKAGRHLGAEVPAVSDFRWSNVFEAHIDPSDKTRLWCEPSVHPKNTFQSHKIASAHLEHIVADLLTSLAAERPGQTMLMANVRDAHLPNAVLSHVQAGCLAFTDSEANLAIGRVVLDFFGRADVRLELPDRLDLIGEGAWDWLTLLIHPDSVDADEARCNAILDRLPETVGVVVGTPRPDRLDALRLGGRRIASAGVSNRHVPEEWRQYTIAVGRGA
jgi:hypothetical protein